MRKEQAKVAKLQAEIEKLKADIDARQQVLAIKAEQVHMGATIDAEGLTFQQERQALDELRAAASQNAKYENKVGP